MIRRELFIVVLTACATAATLPGLSAPTADTGANQQPFSLSAQVNERPQLSRSDVDSGAMVKMTPSQPPNAALSYANFPKPGAFAKSAKAPTAPPASTSGRGTPDNSYLSEKNVDWSGWISGLADRWFYILRQYENGADVQFITQRPALFEFTCYANGQIGNVTLAQSSGNTIYDHLQMVALMQAVPLPPFPAGTKRTSITLLQGWESHIKAPGESDYVPGSFGRNFPMEKVREWVKAR